jgi:hypothetical protein
LAIKNNEDLIEASYLVEFDNDEEEVEDDDDDEEVIDTSPNFSDDRIISSLLGPSRRNSSME